MEKIYNEKIENKTDAEIMWDLRAESFNKSQNKGIGKIEKSVIELLKKKNILKMQKY